MTKRYSGQASAGSNVSAEVLEQSSYSRRTRGERFGLLAKTLKDTAYRWSSEPRWYLWEGGFLLIARAEGVVPAHAHHAIQIVVALDGMVAISGEQPMAQGTRNHRAT
jgi:hypothetical protein